MARTFPLGPTGRHQSLYLCWVVYAFLGWFIRNTTAPLPSLLTTALALSAPVLRTHPRHQRNEVCYWNTGTYDARLVVKGNMIGAIIRGHFDHTVYSGYRIPGVSSESVYVIERVYIIL